MTQISNPFVGLRPFESEDSLFYFGRNEQTKTLLRKLHQHRFVAVVGSSGSGKSSLIRAGLIPQLQAGFLVQDRDQWLISSMKPGDTPLQNLLESVLQVVNANQPQSTSIQDLEQAVEQQGVQGLLDYLTPTLQQSDCNAFLLVDQFEELFRFNQEQTVTPEIEQQRAQAQSFVALLLALAQQQQLPIYVCLTMRSDFLGDCDAFYGLPEAINTSQFLVPRLTRQQRREVIFNPTQLVGASIAPRLVDRLLNESLDTRDDLPILQHVLMRTFDAWQQSDVFPQQPMDVSHYEQIHTIHNALNAHADEALGSLKPEQQSIAKYLFQALTKVDASNRRVRRPVHLQTVCEISQATPQQVMTVINAFREQHRSFLVLSSTHPDDNPLIDISHESLIRQWQQLEKWVDEESQSAKIYRRLVETAQMYRLGTGNYYRDLELKQALDWQSQQQPTATWAQRYNKDFDLAIAFLQQSQVDEKKRIAKEQAAQQQRQQLLEDKAKLESQKRQMAEQQAKQQKQALKRSRTLTGIMSVLALIMVVLAAFAWHLSKQSEEARKDAERSSKKALENELQANYFLAKAYEQKAMFNFDKAERQDDNLQYYRYAWLYALEAEKLKLPEGYNALNKSTLDML